MPRFKNVSPLGQDLETWDGQRFVLVPFGEEFDVTAEAAKGNPTYTHSGVFEPVDVKPAKGAKSGEGDK